MNIFQAATKALQSASAAERRAALQQLLIALSNPEHKHAYVHVPLANTQGFLAALRFVVCNCTFPQRGLALQVLNALLKVPAQRTLLYEEFIDSLTACANCLEALVCLKSLASSYPPAPVFREQMLNQPDLLHALVRNLNPRFSTGTIAAQATSILAILCHDDASRAFLFIFPGLIDATLASIRTFPDVSCMQLLFQFSSSHGLRVPLREHPGVLDTLLHDIKANEEADYSSSTLGYLAMHEENTEPMIRMPGLVLALLGSDYCDWVLPCLFIIGWDWNGEDDAIEEFPLSLFCSRPCRNHSMIVTDYLRENPVSILDTDVHNLTPRQLATNDGFGDRAAARPRQGGGHERAWEREEPSDAVKSRMDVLLCLKNATTIHHAVSDSDEASLISARSAVQHYNGYG